MYLTTRDRIRLAFVLALLLLLILLVSCATVERHGDHDRGIAYAEYMRVVTVKTECDTGLGLQGSGVRIGGHVVLTAMHVLACADDDATITGATVVDLEGHEYETKLAGGSPFSDIARLDVKGLPVVSQVDVGKTEAGQRVCATFALPELGRRCGEVWPTAAADKGDVHVDFVAEHGNSGGAVWDADGRLVGILVHLRWCSGTEGNRQVCTAGVTGLSRRAWLAAP